MDVTEQTAINSRGWAVQPRHRPPMAHRRHTAGTTSGPSPHCHRDDDNQQCDPKPAVVTMDPPHPRQADPRHQHERATPDIGMRHAIRVRGRVRITSCDQRPVRINLDNTMHQLDTVVTGEHNH